MGKTGNITGEVFSPEVIRQIEARQTFLGVNPKQDKHLIYQNNKTAFVRLASSIDIKGNFKQVKETLGNRGLTDLYADQILAEQCVLFGGTVSVNTSKKTFQPKYGVGEGIANANTNLNYSPGGFGDQEIDLTTPSAYGWGGLGSQGYRPMPGIIDANVTFYNRGALAKATVNCKVYSIEQLQIFDLLYFRIGYTMLLEWGHNIFIDNTINNPTLTNRSTFFTQPFKKFFDNNSTQNDIIDLIKTQRQTDSYNYDAMLGKVVNFSWKFNTDGSYDISLNLVGLGDVIEALKINTSTTGNTGKTPNELVSDEEKNLAKRQKELEGLNTNLTNAQSAESIAQGGVSSVSDQGDTIADTIQNFIIEGLKNSIFGTGIEENVALQITNEYAKNNKFETFPTTYDPRFVFDKTGLIKIYPNLFKSLSSEYGNDARGKFPDFFNKKLVEIFPEDAWEWDNDWAKEQFNKALNATPPDIASAQKILSDWLDRLSTYINKKYLETSDYKNIPEKYIYGNNVKKLGSLENANTFILSTRFPDNGNTLSIQFRSVPTTYRLNGLIEGKSSLDEYSSTIFEFSSARNFVLELVKTVGDTNKNKQDTLATAQSNLKAAVARVKNAQIAIKKLEKEIAGLKEKLQTFPASSAEFRDKSTFNRQLYDWTTKIKEVKNSTGVINEPITLNNIQIQSLKAYFKELDPTLTDDKAQTIAITSTISGGTPVGSLASKVDNYIKDLNKNKNPDFCKYSFIAIAQDSEIAGQTLNVDQYYVRLGYMLEWIQNNLLIYSDGKTFEVPKGIVMDVANGVPLFNINTDINGNVLKYFPSQISSDPKICLIPIKFDKPYKDQGLTKTTTDSKTKKSTTDVITKDLNVNWSAFCDSKSTTQADLSNYFIEGESDAARLMNIMVNIDYASGVLAQNVDSNGKVTLLNFLNSLCLGISDSLGNINKLNTIYDGETNELKIIDENGINIAQNQTNTAPANGISEPTIGKFRVYGVNPGTEGSFVTNVDFQVQIPPNMAAMATISAQASGNIAGENATGLSRLNTGLIDRIVPSKLDAASLKSESIIGTTQDPNVIFGTNLNQMNKFVEELYETSKYQTPNVESLKSINRDVSLFETGKRTDANIAPAPFFIPFNLSLDMDGLSGMRNYERFSITEDILPYSYRSSDAENGGVIDFIIKGISHNISNNQWKTKIESQTISSLRKPKTRS